MVIHVLATIQLAAGKREEFLAVMRKLVPKVHAEVGCMAYELAIDVQTNIDAQVPIRQDVVTVVERWTDLAALEAHLNAPHMQEFRTVVAEWVRDLRLQILTPA